MVRVSIDVPALRGVVSDLETFAGRVTTERSGVSSAASRACTSVSSFSSLYDHVATIEDACGELTARIDLAILVNTGDDGQVPDGVLSYEVAADTLSSVQSQIGREMAEMANRPGTRIFGDQLESFDEMFSRYVDDDSVMASFYMAIGPDGLLEFMTEIAQRSGGVDIDLELQQQVLDNLQSGLETASHAWTDSAARNYADQLVEAATADPNAADSHFAAGFPGALSYLLYDSNFSDPFLAAAADGLDAYERLEMSGTNNLWLDRSMGANTVFFDLFPWEARAGHYDPMVSLMSALGNNPGVSLDFFEGGGDSNGDGLPDRQMYWIHDRMWMHDEFLHVSEALLGATTDPSLLDPPDGPDAGRAALLMSSAVNLLGHREGIGYYDAGFFGTSTERSAAASENFALMLSTYMYAVDESLRSGSSADWDSGLNSTNVRAGYYPGVLPNLPLFNHDSLENFMVYAAGNEEGLLILRAGLNEYTAQKYALATEYLQQDGVTDQMAQRIFEEAYLGQARMEGAFIKAIGDASIARAEGEDAVREQWVALGQGAISAIPVGKLVSAAGGDDVTQAVIGFVVNQTTTRSANALKDEWASLADAERAAQRGIAEDTLQLAQYNVFTSLDDAGLLPDSALQEPWANNGQLISYEEFQQLPVGDQVAAISWLRNVEDGAGLIYNPFDFENEFNNQFHRPFD